MSRKKSPHEKRVMHRKIVVICMFLEIAAVVVFLASYLPKIITPESEGYDSKDDRTHCIMIVGDSESLPVLQKVYEGASAVADSYDSVVELYVPPSRASNVSFQSLLDFAGNANADGIIAYFPDYASSVNPPLAREGSYIPLVTIGHNFPDVPQISYIGTTYAETGRRIADEISGWHTEDSVFLMIDSTRNANFSTARSSMLSRLSANGFTDVNLVSFDDTDEAYKERFVAEIQRAKKLEKPLIVICTSETDTIFAAQQVADISYSSETKILGLGESGSVNDYFNRGIISALFSLDYQGVGRAALAQIFEYKQNGSANRIVSAEIQFRRAGAR